jgi:hypothetical protein
MFRDHFFVLENFDFRIVPRRCGAGRRVGHDRCERRTGNKNPGSILPGTELGFQLQLTQGEAPHALS